MKALRLQIIVGGRFHSDEMACALHQMGHRVVVSTTFPRSKFGRLEIHQVEPHIIPEVIFRGMGLLGMGDTGDLIKMKMLGAISRRKMLHLDGIIAWSSFGLEAFRKTPDAFRILVRDSTHIEFQTEILQKEYKRLGMRLSPRKAIVARELEEYQLADQIIVLSEFAKKTFLDKGFAPEKIKVIRLGVDTTRFIPASDYSPSRPLKLIYFGTIGPRKGVDYLLRATANFSPNDLTVHLVGPVERGYKKILSRFTHAKAHGVLSQGHLADFVRRMHLFVMPSLEDGFGQTVIQAMGSGLPCITTSSCGASELIRDRVNGFVVPPNSVQAIGEKIQHFVDDPQLLLAMRKEAIQTALDCSWTSYKDQLAAIIDPHSAARDTAA